MAPPKSTKGSVVKSSLNKSANKESVGKQSTKKTPAKTKADNKKPKEADFSHVTLFRHPIITLVTFIKVLYHFLLSIVSFIGRHYIIFTLLPAIGCAFHFVEGPHTPHKPLIEEITLFSLWWIGLGIASSIGLGTGLHTFVLYLGPHIAKVTIASNECGYVPNFIPSRWNLDHF